MRSLSLPSDHHLLEAACFQGLIVRGNNVPLMRGFRVPFPTARLQRSLGGVQSQLSSINVRASARLVSVVTEIAGMVPRSRAITTSRRLSS